MHTPFPISARRAAIAGAAVLVLAGSAVGIAAAQTPPATPTTQGQTQYNQFLDALAKRLGIQRQNLDTAVSQARQDVGLPAGQGFPGGGRGPRGGFHIDLNTAATAIGIAPQQLQTELNGKSLAQVAQDHQKTANDVATALKNAAHAQIDAQASARGLTADQVAAWKTKADARIDQLVNQVNPQGKGFGGPGGFSRRSFMGAAADAAANALGITTQQLHTELQGKSLADVVNAHGKNLADVTNAMKSAVHTQIDSQAAARGLTPQQVSAEKTQADQRIDQMVDQLVPQRGTGAGADVEDPNL